MNRVTDNASEEVCTTLGDQPPAVGGKRTLLALPGVVLSGAALVLGGGIPGTLGAVLLFAVWVAAPLPYLLAGGTVFGFALLDPAVPLPVVLLIGGLVGAVVGPSIQTDAPVTAAASIVGGFALLAGVSLVVTAAVSSLAGALALATVFALAAYGCHRYSVVRFDLQNSTPQHDGIAGEPNERNDRKRDTAEPDTTDQNARNDDD